MDVAIISVGTELLLGHTRDTNFPYLAARLSDLGARVVWHATVPDFLPTMVAALRDATARADLVIIDLFMPEKEGIETIRELRRLDPHAKIFAVSGGGSRARTDLLPIAKTLGAMRTFRKPVDAEELLTAVKTAIGA